MSLGKKLANKISGNKLYEIFSKEDLWDELTETKARLEGAEKLINILKNLEVDRSNKIILKILIDESIEHFRKYGDRE